MNWAKFQTYNDAPTKAFETLCNQLFENWCKEEYSETLSSFQIVNGFGGDGGVESYAVLSDEKIIGLQAKWFRESITSNQIGQIKNSIITALKLRPKITRYIVCIPRDLASLTGKGDQTESKRWDEMKSEILKDYPKLVLDLWNETRIIHELQKDCSAGILKFWFERAEISDESVGFSFEKSKNSWLATKYLPELNTFGMIHNYISTYLGDIDGRKTLYKVFNELNNICNDFYIVADELINVCGDNEPELKLSVNDVIIKFQNMQSEISKILYWLNEESIFRITINDTAFEINYNYIISEMEKSKEKNSYYFHFSAVKKIFKRFDELPIYNSVNQFKKANDYRSLIVLGDPGTGKTHGVAAETEKLLNEKCHIPILVQARDIPATATWKDILISSLGLADSWSEEEIWQALLSLSNRRRMKILNDFDKVTILPKIIIIVDGIDESSLQDIWLKLVQETDVIIQKYPSIRFCFMSRPYVFRNKDTGAKIVEISHSGDVPTHKLFDNYIKTYNIDVSHAGWVKFSLTTPLALKLFCELNQGKTITHYSSADVSIASLLKKKIKRMEDEYCKEDQYEVSADQYIFKSIVRLAKLFANEKRLKRDDVVNILSNEVINNYERAEKLASYLENYGILHLYCEHGSGLLSPNVYYYYPGIQGYFDYALSLMLIDEYKHPEKIDFKKYKKLPHNSYYVLAIISIQKFNYLITDNSSIIDVISKYFYDELLFFALRHSNLECAEEYKSFVLNLMIKNVDMLRTVLNNIILPLSRETTHPLGISLLHEFLIGFEHPAERDILWSAPDYLLESNNEKWYVSVSFNLGEDSYLLTDIDTADGLPTAFAWALSSLDNNRRQKIRIELIKWGLVVPDEFYKLFLKFSFVNDPQIKSDMFSILMSLLFESDNIELLNTASKWMIENILDPSKIDLNRDVAIRYYATSIVHKAVSMNIIEPSKASDYLPPFNLCSNHIDLSEEAMAGSYMGGYGAITYDLGRYVLVDHITANFPKNMQDGKTQYENLIESIAKEHKKLKGASATQFILSAAYKFITMCGWNEKEFYYYDSSKKKTYGIDYDIKHEYLPKTHGTQSPVMTVCEKYVWQARNYISGFFADRLMLDDIDGASFVKDYSLLDDFIIPSLEIGHTNPDGVNDLYPWHIPEKESVLISGKSNSKEDVINTIKTAPDINWEKWITLDNTHQSYPIDGDRLLALRSFSCFESISGIETNLYLNSILVDICYVEKLIDMVINDSDISNSIRNPSDWVGGVNSNCYLSPKEICWMPWKKRYNSHLADEFGEIKIDSAVDSCVYNFINQGDVSYDLPSVIIREILGIVNTDGYEFYDKDKQIKAISVHVGEKWRTQQYQLLVSDDLLEQLELRGKTLVWIMREERIRNAKATERFGEINAEKDCSYIGYFNKEEFVIKEIPIKETKKFDSSIILSELLDQLGY